MKAGWTVLFVFLVFVLGVLYFAIGNRVFIGFGYLGIIALLAGHYLIWEYLIKVCDGQFTKSRPTPELPLTLNAPDLTASISGLLISILSLIPVYFAMKDRASQPELFSTIFFYIFGFGILGVSVFCISFIGFFRKHKIAELTIEGIHAKFTPLLTGTKKNFISWQELENAYGYMGGFKVPVREIRFNLKDGSGYKLTGAIHAVSFKELTPWLQEYLSRYGSGAKPAI